MRKNIISISVIAAVILLLMAGSCAADSVNHKDLSKSDDGASADIVAIKDNITKFMESEGFTYEGMSTNGHVAYIAYTSNNNSDIQVSFTVTDYDSKAIKLSAHSASAVKETINGIDGLFYQSNQGEVYTQNFLYKLPDQNATVQIQLAQPSDYSMSEFVQDW